MISPSLDTFKCHKTLKIGHKEYHYFSLPELAKQVGEINSLPFSLKVLLENLLRHENGNTVTTEDVQALVDWIKTGNSSQEIGFHPARVLMQDFTGVPAIVDLATMRDAVVVAGGDPTRINPLIPVDLVIDHSVMVDKFGTAVAFDRNVEIEYERNRERYQFLRWGQKSFDNFRVVPPGTGICHQVNLEYLGKAVWQKTDDEGRTWAYPDTLVGTDSHTTMINGLGVLGWGVGGIEAEAAMLGQPLSMLIPEVIGMKFVGKLQEGVTATDLVLTVTELLRKEQVVGKFVEYFGEGLADLSLADRATLSNMSPEYGATCGFFPVDERTLEYMRLTGRDDETIALVEEYCKLQGLWHDPAHTAKYTKVLELDLSTVVPSLAGPYRPQDRVPLTGIKASMESILKEANKSTTEGQQVSMANGDKFELNNGDVVIAAITSCTNTSNPSVMLAAGLVAKKAIELGLQRKPWVKSSLAPGSKVVTDYLKAAGLDNYLDELGFDLVGYGCTTCIGNSGPLIEEVGQAVDKGNLIVSSVLSGNRNFEGRIHPQVKANWLASPPLVVAYALAGSTRIDISTAPLGNDKNGNPVYLKDIWPTNAEISEAVKSVTSDMFKTQYSAVFDGDEHWQALEIPDSETYEWRADSTYVANPPFFDDIDKPAPAPADIKGARVLAILGDTITTDHISPAGAIQSNSPAGKYLQENGVAVKDFNSYGSRRGNHEVMMRGTFANIRIKNLMLAGTEGGYTRHIPDNEEMSIYDAAMRYQSEGTPLVVLAGKEYGTGSSRDWAAKGTRLLGVKAVIAESYERIHRSNLVGMGVLPLQFKDGESAQNIGLNGEESIDIIGLDENIQVGQTLQAVATKPDGSTIKFELLCRIDTANEITYFLSGGILHHVIRELVKAK